MVMDGIYTYIIFSTDDTGKKSNQSKEIKIVVDASAPKVRLSLNNNFISPNNDNINDYAILEINVESRNKLKHQTLKIINEKTKKVITIDPKNRTELTINSYIYNKNLQDGFYTIQYIAEYKNAYKSVDSVRMNINRSIKTNIKISNEPLYLDGNNYIKGSFFVSLGLDENTILKSFNLKVLTKGGDILLSKINNNLDSGNIIFLVDSMKHEEHL